MILASQSPRRIELMREAGFDIAVVPADIDETPLPDESPLELVERLACAKAQAIARAQKIAATHDKQDEVIVAADTIVAIDGEKLGKPRNEKDAQAMLRRLSGRTHQVATGVCIIRGNACESFTEVTDVTFYELSASEIEGYVASEEPMDKAGAYGIQGVGGRMLVKKIDGDFYNVVGLPIARVVRELHALGA